MVWFKGLYLSRAVKTAVRLLSPASLSHQIGSSCQKQLVLSPFKLIEWVSNVSMGIKLIETSAVAVHSNSGETGGVGWLDCTRPSEGNRAIN